MSERMSGIEVGRIHFQGILGRSLMRARISKSRYVWEILSGVMKLYSGTLENELEKPIEI